MSDTHKRIHNLLPDGAKAKTDIHYSTKLDRWGEPTEKSCWYDYDEISDEVAEAAIERDAIVWLMGRASMRLIESRDDDGVVVGINFRGVLYAADTLADALLQAVEREVADSKSNLEIDHA